MASPLLHMAICSLLCVTMSVAVESPADSPGDVDIKAVLSKVMKLEADMEDMKSALHISSLDSRALRGDVVVEDSGVSRDEVKQLIMSELDKLKAAPKIRRSAESSSRPGGTNYIRWGRTTCEGDAISVYRGYAAGPHYTQGGGGSNFLCLHETPQWNKYIPGIYTWTGMIYGVEYDVHADAHVFSTSNNGGQLLDNYPSPCVACFKPHTSTVMMIPARIQCPSGWNLEYHGYIISEMTHGTQSRHRSQYTCWDSAPESAVGATVQHQSVIYPVQIVCGSLPCSRYVTGWELTCVVCSR